MSTPGTAPIRIKQFITVEISGDGKHVAKYADLLRLELATTVNFIDAMFESAEPTLPKSCHAIIHETKVEIA